MSATDAPLHAFRAAMAAAPEGPVGVGVSGGGDSVALLLMLRRWGAETGRAVAAVTVDHGLRAGSADEARAVAALCARVGVPHDVLAWSGWDGRGNLQDRARGARRELIAGWAQARGIRVVALGHTLDDQAETFLMRLARGSGVDGLAGMAAASRRGGVLWLRPLLGTRRAALRAWLAGQGVAWAEDPSNADPRFDRVRARAALGPLATLGLGPERLAATATRMARARAALEAATAGLARACLRAGPAGDLELDPRQLAGAPLELRLRLLAAALCWVAGAAYRPRLAALEAALAAVERGAFGHGLTLHGCVLRPWAGAIVIRREPARVAGPVPPSSLFWDGRWQLCGDPPTGEGVEIGALGAGGLARCPGWRAAGPAREALVTTPALWRGGELIAAPFVRSEPAVGFRRVSALPPPWALGDSALNPGRQPLC